MFKQLAAILMRHNNPSTSPRKAVDDFRAAKRALGYSPREISNMLVASRIQSEARFISDSYSDDLLDSRNWGYLLDNPLPALPTQSWIEYPNDWRELQISLRREGCPGDLIDDVLQDIAARRRREAQPPAMFATGPRQELPGARVESVARLFEQGFTRSEVAQIIGARSDTSRRLGVRRYPNSMDAPMHLLLAAHEKEPAQPELAARPALRLVASNNRAPKPR